MTYAFVLGKNPTLSIAELANRFALLGWDFSILILTQQVAIIKINNQLVGPQEMLDRLGGCQKIGELLDDFVEFSEAGFIEATIAWCEEQKIDTLGFSCYNLPKSLCEKVISSGWQIKNELKKAGKFRYILGREPQLSAATVIANKLNSPGKSELLVIGKPSLVGVFRGVAIQNINDYTLRDFEKPYRDPKAGMLPPKLAQIMINLAGVAPPTKIYDPFCGTGTILMEGLLAGFEVVGSDEEVAQVAGTQRNLSWLEKKFNLSRAKYKVFQADATKIDPALLGGAADTIVSELYLGPRFLPRNQVELKKIEAQVMTLYEKFLASASNIGVAKFVLAFPVYKLGNQVEKLPLLDLFSKLSYTVKSPLLSEIYSSNKQILTAFDESRQSITYLLPDQKVGREIFILETEKYEVRSTKSETNSKY